MRILSRERAAYDVLLTAYREARALSDELAHSERLRAHAAAMLETLRSMHAVLVEAHAAGSAERPPVRP